MAKSKLIARCNRNDVVARGTMDNDGLIVVIKTKPNAATEKLEINEASEIVLSVRAPAVEGAANERVRELLAAFFETAKSRVIIVHGEHSRTKKILIRN